MLFLVGLCLILRSLMARTFSRKLSTATNRYPLKTLKFSLSNAIGIATKADEDFEAGLTQHSTSH